MTELFDWLDLVCGWVDDGIREWRWSVVDVTVVNAGGGSGSSPGSATIAVGCGLSKRW